MGVALRALVTGCAGFIGSHLTRSLLEDGHDVVGVDCFTDNYGRPAKLANLAPAREWDGFDLVALDLADGGLHGIVDGADVVFHLAGEPGVRPSWGARFDRYLRGNVLATQRLLEAIAGHPGVRLVAASSSSVYGQASVLPTHEDAVTAPVSPYGVTKLAAEHLCRTYGERHGLAVVQLRLFSVFGPRQRPDMAFARFCAAIQGGEPITVHGDGGQTRDFTYVGDVVSALRAAATTAAAAGRTLNVGGGVSIRLEDAIGALLEISGCDAQVRWQAPAAGDARDTSAAIGAAAEVLGYRPSVGLVDGLEAQWTWATGQERAVTT